MASMIIVMMVSVIILEHYFEYHVAFGLLVASVMLSMMLGDIMLWEMMKEMMNK